jgi:hypothetical protein
MTRSGVTGLVIAALAVMTAEAWAFGTKFTVTIPTKETGATCGFDAAKSTCTGTTSHPCPADKKPRIEASKGDTVMWVFKNNCSKTMTLAVGNFRPAGGFTNTDNAGNPLPFDADPTDNCVKQTKVGAKKSKSLNKCGFKLKFTARDGVKHKHPDDSRSYDYDILGDGQKLADPQIEVRP